MRARPRSAALPFAILATCANAIAPACAEDADDVFASRGCAIVEYGVVETGPSAPSFERLQPGALTGFSVTASRFRVTVRTDDICARLGGSFGLRYRMDGTGSQTIAAVWDHPLLRTSDGRSARRDTFLHELGPGTHGSAWTFRDRYLMAPGRWTISILRDGEVAVRKSFSVSLDCETPIS